MLVCFSILTDFHVFNLLKNQQLLIIAHCCSHHQHNHVWSLTYLINWLFNHTEFLTNFTSHAAVIVYFICHQSLKLLACHFQEFCHHQTVLSIMQICQFLILHNSACCIFICQLIQHHLHFLSFWHCFNL